MNILSKILGFGDDKKRTESSEDLVARCVTPETIRDVLDTPDTIRDVLDTPETIRDTLDTPLDSGIDAGIDAGIDESEICTTENGELSFTTIGSKNIDFFGKVNRDIELEELITLFEESFNENYLITLKVLFNFRDCRGGKGEKKITHFLMFALKVVHTDLYENILPYYLELGYWKDLLYICEIALEYGTDCNYEVGLFANKLKEDSELCNLDKKISLCAKWAPSECSKYIKVAKLIMKKLGHSPKEYRKMLSKLRAKLNVLECNMSSGNYDRIDFAAVPSKAHMLYKDSFKRDTNHEGEELQARINLHRRYLDYLDKLQSGEESIKFKGIHPHELIRNLSPNCDDNKTIEAQWASLRNDIIDKGTFDNVVSIVDVSGSMTSNTTNCPIPIEVSVALGILLSECAKGSWKDKLITFHSSPTIVNLSEFSLLSHKVSHVKRMPWGGNTNIEKVFMLLLNIGIKEKLTSEQMPKKLFIFTDMQFDQVDSNYDTNDKLYNKIKELYNDSGYELPQIINWNLRSVDNIPFRMTDKGVCLLSGYSHELMKSVIDGDIDPHIIFMKCIEGYKVPDHTPITDKVNIRQCIDINKLKILYK